MILKHATYKVFSGTKVHKYCRHPSGRFWILLWSSPMEYYLDTRYWST